MEQPNQAPHLSETEDRYISTVLQGWRDLLNNSRTTDEELVIQSPSGERLTLSPSGDLRIEGKSSIITLDAANTMSCTNHHKINSSIILFGPKPSSGKRSRPTAKLLSKMPPIVRNLLGSGKVRGEETRNGDLYVSPGAISNADGSFMINRAEIQANQRSYPVPVAPSESHVLPIPMKVQMEELLPNPEAMEERPSEPFFIDDAPTFSERVRINGDLFIASAAPDKSPTADYARIRRILIEAANINPEIGTMYNAFIHDGRQNVTLISNDDSNNNVASYLGKNSVFQRHNQGEIRIHFDPESIAVKITYGKAAIQPSDDLYGKLIAKIPPEMMQAGSQDPDEILILKIDPLNSQRVLIRNKEDAITLTSLDISSEGKKDITNKSAAEQVRIHGNQRQWHDPRITALHESAHAYQQLASPDLSTDSQNSQDPAFTNRLEREVIRGVEQRALATLGLEPRDSHHGISLKSLPDEDITSTKALLHKAKSLPGANLSWEQVPNNDSEEGVVENIFGATKTEPSIITLCTDDGRTLAYRKDELIACSTDQNWNVRGAAIRIQEEDGRFRITPRLSSQAYDLTNTGVRLHSAPGELEGSAEILVDPKRNESSGFIKHGDDSHTLVYHLDGITSLLPGYDQFSPSEREAKLVADLTEGAGLKTKVNQQGQVTQASLISREQLSQSKGALDARHENSMEQPQPQPTTTKRQKLADILRR